MVRVIQEKKVYPNSQEVVRSVVRRKRAKGVLLGTPIFKGKVDKLKSIRPQETGKRRMWERHIERVALWELRWVEIQDRKTN